MPGELEHGVVYDPLRQEIFSASRGQGAQLDGHKIRVSKRTTLRPALIATGLPYRANLKHLDRYLDMLRAVMLETAGIRRPGLRGTRSLLRRGRARRRVLGDRA